MTTSTKSKKKIFDYILGNDNVPPKIMKDFSRWLIQHENDRETEEIMLSKWEEFSDERFTEEDFAELERIRKSIHSKPVKFDKKYYRTVIFGLCACISFALFFIAGLLSSPILKSPEKEISLITSDGNIAEFSLPDGTKVWLNENSRLTYPEKFNSRKRSVSLIGEGYFEVRKDSLHPFSVKMKTLEIEVLGTSFGASCYECDSKEEVVLKTGRVAISGTKLNAPVLMEPDQILKFSPSDNRVEISHIDASNQYRWYERHLTFYNAELGDVIANIERRYRTDIQLETSISLHTRLSLTILQEPLEAVMDAITALLPVKYGISDGIVTISDR